MLKFINSNYLLITGLVLAFFGQARSANPNFLTLCNELKVAADKYALGEKPLPQGKTAHCWVEKMIFLSGRRAHLFCFSNERGFLFISARVNLRADLVIKGSAAGKIVEDIIVRYYPNANGRSVFIFFTYNEHGYRNPIKIAVVITYLKTVGIDFSSTKPNRLKSHIKIREIDFEEFRKRLLLYQPRTDVTNKSLKFNDTIDEFEYYPEQIMDVINVDNYQSSMNQDDFLMECYELVEASCRYEKNEQKPHRRTKINFAVYVFFPKMIRCMDKKIMYKGVTFTVEYLPHSHCIPQFNFYHDDIPDSQVVINELFSLLELKTLAEIDGHKDCTLQALKEKYDLLSL